MNTEMMENVDAIEAGTFIKKETETTEEITIQEIEQMRKISEEKRKERKREIIAIRLPAATVKKARAFGKGYTRVLARLLEMALNDPEMIEKAL